MANKKNFLFFNFLLIFCLFYNVFCQPSSEKEIKITDFRGKELRFKKPVSRIVCCIESALSGIYMLGAEELVVGVPTSVYYESPSSQYAALDSRIKSKNLPCPCNWDFVNIEKIFSLQPDIVIIWSEQKESIEILEKKGIMVYGVFLHSFNDVYKEISDFGLITNRVDRAQYLNTLTQNQVKLLQEKINKIPIDNKVKIYFMWAQGPLETSGKRSTVNDLLELAGAINVCNEPQEHLTVNIENVIKWNPDVIIRWNNPSKKSEDIRKSSIWRNIKAVKNNRIFELPPLFFCDFWTLKFFYAAKLIATWCYPEQFDSIEVKKECRNMLDTLYGERGTHIFCDEK